MAFLKSGTFWKEQVDLALAARKKHETWWDANLKAYAPAVGGSTSPEAWGSDIHTNRTFTMVERKKSDLFYRRPDVSLKPSPLLEDGADPQTAQMLGQALEAHQAIVNEKLGEDGIDATEMMDAVVFDIITTQGTGWTEMGYESVTVDQPATTKDPTTGAEVPILDAEGKQRIAPVPVAEKCFWEHFSGKQALIPHNWRSTQWEKAPWLGRRFELPLTEGNRKKYDLPPDFQGKSDTTQYYDYGETQTAGKDVFTGAVIWYRSALYRDDVVHPDHFTLLILVDGLERDGGVAVQKDSPHQTLGPDGKLTPDSLIGNPIHPFSVRTMTDSAYVPSDATMIRPLESELDTFRTQMVQFRDACTLKYMANGDVLPKESLEKIVRAPIGGIVTVPGDAYNQSSIKPLEGGSMPRESFVSNDYIDNDIARTLGIDAQQAGVAASNAHTATADQIQQQNANARLDKERSQILKRYCKGVTKFATLIARYTPVEDATKIVGAQRAQLWAQFVKAIPCELAFTAMPDSALRVDAAVDRKQAMDLYSFLANDPLIQKGRAKLLTKLLQKFHLDPSGIVAAPDPPKPEPPKLSFSFKGEDLIGPQAPIVLGIAQQLGLQIDPSWITLSQGMLQQDAMLAAQADAKDAEAKGETKHGGKLAQQESLSKHHADQTGGMQGSGMPAAMGAPGGMIQ